jgi:uncharacterized DUF497 family protein
MKYEWDEAKNRNNLAKHGLSFEDAEQAGLLAGRLVVIAHAQRDEGTRIISMRKGNRREQKIYEERLGTD